MTTLQEQKIARALAACVTAAEAHAKAVTQSLAVLQAVTAHPDTPARWPLTPPWPEGWVIWNTAIGGFRARDAYRTCPYGYVQRLELAFICTTPVQVTRFTRGREGDLVWTVAEACAHVANGTLPTPEAT